MSLLGKCPYTSCSAWHLSNRQEALTASYFWLIGKRKGINIPSCKFVHIMQKQSHRPWSHAVQRCIKAADTEPPVWGEDTSTRAAPCGNLCDDILFHSKADVLTGSVCIKGRRIWRSAGLRKRSYCLEAFSLHAPSLWHHHRSYNAAQLPCLCLHTSGSASTARTHPCTAWKHRRQPPFHTLCTNLLD